VTIDPERRNLEAQVLAHRYAIQPFLDALAYVVQEGRKHQLEGNDDHFVAVARAANAALLWHKADQSDSLDLAEQYLKLIPKPRSTK